jgi:SAM-dependent methyltransferase
VILDESAFSDIDDSTHADEIRDAAYHGADIRPAWIGGHRPRTSVESLKGLANWASIHYDYYLNFVREHMERRGNVLDIGCGAGQCVNMLARYSESATGIDSDAYVIDFAGRHNLAPNAAFVLGSFPFQSSESYDYIFCVETIEHVAYEKQFTFIDVALGMLREGGMMFITTPREDTPSPPHVGVWSPKWADEMATHLGKRMVRRAYFSNTAPVGFLDAPSTHHAWVLA